MTVSDCVDCNGFVPAGCIPFDQRVTGHIDPVKGANIAGFRKAADAMLPFGLL